MKAKTIKWTLERKFKALLDSIDDEDVKKLVANNTIITGGSIASMLLQEDVNDFDLYFRNRETVLAVARYYVKKFGHEEIEVREERNSKGKVIEGGRISIFIQSDGVREDPDSPRHDDEAGDMPEREDIIDELEEAQDEGNPNGGPYHVCFMSSNAITLSDQIQLVIRFFGEPEEIHDNYDFVHCMNYWKSWDRELVLNTEALESLLTRELRYCGSKYPLCSIIRTRKFLKRGWSINAGQYLKMAMQMNELDLRDIKVLEDQLVGVDATYFAQVINEVTKHMEEGNLDRIDNLYVVQIIDKIF